MMTSSKAYLLKIDTTVREEAEREGEWEKVREKLCLENKFVVNNLKNASQKLYLTEPSDSVFLVSKGK